MREERRDGHIYVTASEIRHQESYGDVTPGLLRSWVAAGHLTVVTVAELVAAFGGTLPDGINPNHPARLPGPGGRENVYRWSDVVRAETATRHARRRRGGKPRRADNLPA